jgi:hypothetical protein
MVCSAACHPVYSLCTGSLPCGERLFEVQGYCFRSEESPEAARMQSFRMHELVYVGHQLGAIEHQASGLSLASIHRVAP